MLSFKKFVSEAPIIDTSIENIKEPADYGHPRNEPKRQTLSKMGDNTVKELSLTPYRTSYTLHDKDNKIAIKATGKKDGNKFTINSLESSQKAPVKAHEFYHHLITNNDVHLHSDIVQSPGGKKVWERLRGMPNIKIQTYHPDGSYKDIPSSQSLDKYYDSPSIRLAAKKS